MFTDDSVTQNCFEKKYDGKAAGFMTFICFCVTSLSILSYQYTDVQVIQVYTGLHTQDYTIQDHHTQDHHIQDHTIQD